MTDTSETKSQKDEKTLSEKQVNLLSRLINAYHEENLIIFVGAGISKCIANSSAMLWPKAVEKMQQSMDTHETDPLRLAQLFFQQHPEKYKELVHSMIDETAKPSAVHQLIAQLHPRIIITTNWDCLLEQASVEAFQFYDVISCDEELVTSKRPNKIIKMHGDFARNDGRFVFKEDDYLNYSHNFPLIETFIKSTIVTNNVLFLGYSYSDINLKMIMTWLKQNKQSANIPLYVITEFVENKAQIDYLQNWGLETYICDEVSLESRGLDLPSDDNEISRKIFSFLKRIYTEDVGNNSALSTFLNKSELYRHLPAISFPLITSFISGAEIICDKCGNPILNVKYDPRHDNTSNLISQLKKKTPDNKQVEQFKSFIKKAGIINVSENSLSVYSDPNLLWDTQNTNLSYLDDIKDIEEYLSFKIVSYDKNYNRKTHYKLITETFQKGNIAKAFIEMFNRNVYGLLTEYPKDSSNNIIESSMRISYQTVYESLPSHLRKEYQVFISVLTFEKLKNKTNKLLELIWKKLSMIRENKKQEQKDFFFSFDNTDESDINKLRAEHLDFLRFAWLNKLCIDYYIEVKEYNYLAIKYVTCLFIYHNLSVSWKRFELSSAIHFLNTKQITELLNKDTYFLEDKFNLHLEENDIIWLIEEVLPNLVIKARERGRYDGTQWHSRIGYVFEILSHTNNVTADAITKTLHFIIHEKTLLDDPYNIWKPIVLFLRTKHDQIKGNNYLQEFIDGIKNTCLNIIHTTSDFESPFIQEKIIGIFNIFMTYKDDLGIVINDDNFINEFMNKFIRSSWNVKCRLAGPLSFFLSFLQNQKKQNQIEKIKQDLGNKELISLHYHIYTLLLVLMKIIDLSHEALCQIRESQEIKQSLNCTFNSEIDWLRSTLLSVSEHNEYDQKLIDDIKNTLESLVFKSPIN